MKKSTLSLLFAGAVACFWSPAVSFAQGENLKISGDVQAQYIYEDNSDLHTRNDKPSNSSSLGVRLKALYKAPGDAFDLFWEGRFLGRNGDNGYESDTGEVDTTGRSYSEWRESWIRVNHIAGIYPLNLQVGRQRLREDRNLWWNRNIDAVRLNYDGTLFDGTIGVAENLFAYRTYESDIAEDEDDRTRVFAKAMYQWKKGHHAGVMALYENDHSGTERIGQQILADDRDEEDFNLFWGCVRAFGEYEPDTAIARKVKYHLDIAGVGGEEDIITSVAGSSAKYRNVSAVSNRNVMGWAVDANVEVGVDTGTAIKPTFVLGYAYGSGDDDSTGKDEAFRQSDLHGNTSRIGESSSTIHNYGEALRPELSNLHVFTAGVSVPILEASDTTLLYHYYRLDEKSSGPRSDNLRASVNGTDADLGYGVDLVTNFDLDKELAPFVQLPLDTRLRASAGTFVSGDAYYNSSSNAEDEVMFRALVELKVKF